MLTRERARLYGLRSSASSIADALLWPLPLKAKLAELVALLLPPMLSRSKRVMPSAATRVYRSAGREKHRA
jgi:hypothetical protein